MGGSTQVHPQSPDCPLTIYHCMIQYRQLDKQTTTNGEQANEYTSILTKQSKSE